MLAQHLRSRQTIFGGLLLSASIAGALALSVGTGSSSAPGAAPSFSAFANGTPVPAASLPSDVQAFVGNAAAEMRMSPATASKHVYLVRSSMGAEGLDMYAFADSLGRPCFVVSMEAGTCDVNAQTELPGFYWLLGGGDGGSAPSYLMAMAGDDVQAVTLTIDGEKVPVSLENNVAFAEFPNTAKSATMTVQYTNGDQKSDSLSLG